MTRRPRRAQHGHSDGLARRAGSWNIPLRQAGPATDRLRRGPEPFAETRSMGISMVVYGAPDPDLRAFAVAPLTLKAWLRHSETLNSVSLHGYWRDLDAILGAGTAAGSGSRLTPARADWTFAGAADRGAHALSSVSTRELLQSIDQVTRADVEAFVKQRWAAQAGRTGDPPDLTPLQLETSTEELLVYLARLRDACVAAGAKGHGLLLALWETP